MNIDEYIDCDAIELAHQIRLGAVSAKSTLDAAYSIIDQLDPSINAFVSLEKEQAYATADMPGNGPLAGVPIAMKDCLGLVKGASRSFGSRLCAGTPVGFDEEVVVRHKAAGLIPIGTTNVPEFSSSISTESVLHGPCRNPWNPDHSSGGSSGGAAAAVAYGAIPIAYGNDAAGSIRIPASCCGLFGFRPSRGRVPTGPVEGEIWFGLMAHHVISRSVRDSAIALDLTEGIDVGAPYGAPDKLRNYLDELAHPPKRLRIALSDGSQQGFSAAHECLTALDETAELLSKLGHEICPVSMQYSGEELLTNVTDLLGVALAVEIPALAAESGRKIDSSTVEACQRALMERGGLLTALDLTRILNYRTQLGRQAGRFFADYDLLLTPTLAEPPIALGILNPDSDDLDGYLDRFMSYSPYTPLANMCGLPSMSVPLNWTASGLPVGMMFTGRYADEATLFQLASQLEQARPWRDRHPPISAWKPQS